MKIPGTNLIRQCQRFLANDDFHNPVTDKNQSLLSTKEKIKGKVLPALTHAGMLATTLAFYSALSVTGLAPLTTIPVAISFLTLAIVHGEVMKRSKHKRMRRGDEGATYYNLESDQEKNNFCTRFPDKGPAIVDNYLILSKKFEFREAPHLVVFENKKNERELMGATVSSFGPQKTNLVLTDDKFINKYSSDEIIGTVAHEFAHLKLNHARKDWLHKHATELNTVLCIVAIADVSTTVGVKAAFSAASILTNTFANKKRSQYNEREADRLAMKISGMSESFEQYIAKQIHDREVDMLVEPKLSHRFLRAFLGLASTHPSSTSRYIYAKQFSEENVEHCRKARADCTLAAPAPKA